MSFDPSRITPQQAQFYLQQAISEGKLNGTDIRIYQGRIGNEVANLESRIAELRGEAMTSKRGPGRPRVSGNPAPKKTPVERDEYNKLLYTFAVAQRALYSKIRKAQGKDTALALMKQQKASEAATMAAATTTT